MSSFIIGVIKILKDEKVLIKSHKVNVPDVALHMLDWYTNWLRAIRVVFFYGAIRKTKKHKLLFIFVA